MKKTLAIFLSVLLICISIAPMSLAVDDASPIKTRIIDGAYDSSAAEVDAVEGTTFTLIISTKGAVKNLTDLSLYVEFDPEVLSVKAAGEAGVADEEGEITPNLAGFSVYDMRSGVNNQYAYGWISSSGVSKDAATDCFYITFVVLDLARTSSAIAVYVDSFKTDDGNDSNDISKTMLAVNPTVDFVFSHIVPTEYQPDTTAAAATSADINTLLQLIRDMLSGKGVTFSDFADAITNVLGNSEITMMIEQLVDSDVDISEAFRSILESLGLDFDALVDILNKIIDFFKGLFNKDKPTEPASTAVNTTAKGSSEGSEETGDAGIALATAVCLVASASFVFTRKKKETV